MNDASLTSIIVPAYNASSKIEQTLTSLVEQTSSNYEIIIVNDASTDNTEEIARDFLNRHNVKFQIITHEKNRGVSAARNSGIKAAHGDYICFVDSDDTVDKNYVSLLREKIIGGVRTLFYAVTKFITSPRINIRNVI